MTVTRIFLKWCNAEHVELLVPIGYASRVTRSLIVFRPVAGHDWFGFPLSYDDFTTGASDYDIASDEIYCPCGVTLPWDGDAGDLLRRIDDHCADAKHPTPVRSETT